MSFSESVTVVSVVIAAASFVYGVSAWRREFLGKRQIELAEDVLSLAYEIEEVIRYIRSPFSNISEGHTRQRQDYESEEETELLNRAYVVFERYSSHEEKFAKFRSMKFRFKATFGRTSAEPFEEIDKVIKEIFASAHILGSHYWPRQGRVQMQQDEFQKHLDEMHHHEAVYWYQGDERDEIGPRVSNAIQRIEEEVQRANFRRESLFRKISNWWGSRSSNNT